MFDENKINRDQKGRFAEKSENCSQLQKIKELERKYDDNPQNTSHSETSKRQRKKELSSMTKEQFFGVEYKGVKGKAAIDKLLQERQGHVKAAFYRKEVGDIDLVWGNESGGLEHVLIRRDKMKANGSGTISGVEMANKIPDIIEKGKLDIDEQERIGFIFDKCRVAIRPTYDGQVLTWLVSAMELKK